MIPTETEGPAKLAWHKSTRIKKKELQSDFTQDFGLDLDYQFFSGQTVFTGVGAGYRCRPPVKTILAGDQDLFSRSLAILHSDTHHQLTSAKLIRAIFCIQHHQLIVQHRIGVEASAQRGRDGFRA